MTQVLDAALRYAGLFPGKTKRWLRGLRWTPFLPKVSARVSQSHGRGDYLDLRPDAPDRIDLNTRYTLAWEVRISWQLERFAFDERELAVERAAQPRRRQRQQLIGRVIKLYYDRQQLQEQLKRAEDVADDETRALTRRLRRVTALLHTLTGGELFAPNARPPGA